MFSTRGLMSKCLFLGVLNDNYRLRFKIGENQESPQNRQPLPKNQRRLHLHKKHEHSPQTKKGRATKRPMSFDPTLPFLCRTLNTVSFHRLMTKMSPATQQTSNHYFAPNVIKCLHLVTKIREELALELNVNDLTLILQTWRKW